MSDAANGSSHTTTHTHTYTITLFFPLSIKSVDLFIFYFFWAGMWWYGLFVITKWRADTTGYWPKIQKLCFKIIYNPFAALLIIVCIVLNTLCMAIDHHDMNIELDRVLRTSNYVSKCCNLILFIYLFIFVVFRIFHFYCCAQRRVRWVRFYAFEYIPFRVQYNSGSSAYMRLHSSAMCMWWPNVLPAIHTFNLFNHNKMTKTNSPFYFIISAPYMRLYVFIDVCVRARR